MAVFIDLWYSLFTTKLSYAQLFKWGHSIKGQDVLEKLEQLEQKMYQIQDDAKDKFEELNNEVADNSTRISSTENQNIEQGKEILWKINKSAAWLVNRLEYLFCSWKHEKTRRPKWVLSKTFWSKSKIIYWNVICPVKNSFVWCLTTSDSNIYILGSSNPPIIADDFEQNYHSL